MDVLFNVVGIVVYIALGLLALWGAFLRRTRVAPRRPGAIQR